MHQALRETSHCGPLPEEADSRFTTEILTQTLKQTPTLTGVFQDVSGDVRSDVVDESWDHLKSSQY